MLGEFCFRCWVQLSTDIFSHFQIAQRMAMMDWSESEIGKTVEETFMYGNHNSLCLAHGREPIIPVSIDVIVNMKSLHM